MGPIVRRNYGRAGGRQGARIVTVRADADRNIVTRHEPDAIALLFLGLRNGIPFGDDILKEGTAKGRSNPGRERHSVRKLQSSTIRNPYVLIYSVETEGLAYLA